MLKRLKFYGVGMQYMIQNVPDNCVTNNDYFCKIKFEMNSVRGDQYGKG